MGLRVLRIARGEWFRWEVKVGSGQILTWLSPAIAEFPHVGNLCIVAQSKHVASKVPGQDEKDDRSSATTAISAWKKLQVPSHNPLTEGSQSLEGALNIGVFQLSLTV